MMGVDKLGPETKVLNLLQQGKYGPKANELNLMTILAHDSRWEDRIRFDEMAREVTIDGRAVRDTDTTNVVIWLQRNYQIDFAATKVSTVIDKVGYSNAYHPVTEWLQTLEWDGVERIGTWIQDYMGAEDTQLYRAYGRRWILQCAWRGLRPGCQADSALIIYSPQQGLGKSTALRALAGAKWAGEAPLEIGSPQSVGIALRNKWIYELAELASLSKKGQEEIKHFLTIKRDDYRPPYGRREDQCPRTTCFAGTTNSGAIVQDPTGSRRFWIFEAGVEDHIYPKRLGQARYQLFAECVHYIREALSESFLTIEDLANMDEDQFFQFAADVPDYARWWLTVEEEALRIEDVHRFTCEDPWEEELRSVLTEEKYTSGQILDLLKVDPSTASGVWRRLGPLLQQAGYERFRTAHFRGWRRINRDTRSAQIPLI